MSIWSTFWTWTFLVAIIFFAGMAVVVAIGGFFDLRALFSSLREQHEKQER